jgi:hypothetical protein
MRGTTNNGIRNDMLSCVSAGIFHGLFFQHVERASEAAAGKRWVSPRSTYPTH